MAAPKPFASTGPASTALLDAQQAMGIIRRRANEFHIDADRIGALGFSAGGDLVILGPLGVVHRAAQGVYVADYGGLGGIEFAIK